MLELELLPELLLVLELLLLLLRSFVICGPLEIHLMRRRACLMFQERCSLVLCEQHSSGQTSMQLLEMTAVFSTIVYISLISTVMPCLYETLRFTGVVDCVQTKAG